MTFDANTIYALAALVTAIAGLVVAIRSGKAAQANTDAHEELAERVTNLEAPTILQPHFTATASPDGVGNLPKFSDSPKGNP